MWKIILAFIAFAAFALFIISKGGDKVDMSGEKHGTETHAPADNAAKPAAAPAPEAASVPASAASK